jgi:O-antigen biosynthesis protein
VSLSQRRWRSAAILEDATHRPVNHVSPTAGVPPLLCLYRRRRTDHVAAALARLPSALERIVVSNEDEAVACPVIGVESGGDPAIAALCAAARAMPGRDLLLLDADTVLPDHALERLALAVAALPQADVWTTLGPHIADHDPRVDASLDPQATDRWSWLLSDRSLPETRQWSDRCSLWRAPTLARLSEGDGRPPPDLHIRLCDLLYVDTACATPLAGSSDPVPAVHAMRTRLRGRRGTPAAIGLDGRPVLLHVLHGWGGGAERFVRDLAASDQRFHHLVLCAAGDPGRLRHGERLELYCDLEAAPVRCWPLSSPILATALDSTEYREVLAALREDFAVSSVLVSSLIGHSLDALRTGLPTAVVCHDYYPLWPQLHADFGDAGRDFSPAAIAPLVDGIGDRFEFAERRGAWWTRLRSAYLQALQAANARLIAPTAGVRANQCRIAPELANQRWHVIEHGLAPWPSWAEPLACIPKHGRGPLRVVVTGRIRGGKGETLLAELIPDLPDDVELILLGAGAAGMRFFGSRRVHLQLDYRREELPQLLSDLHADIALLPSTVAETYSYMLSELRSLGMPVIATRLGSFAERVRNGVDGFLVPPDAKALRSLLADLSAERMALRQLQPAPAPPTVAAMAEAYAAVLEAADHVALRVQPGGLAATRSAHFESMQATLRLALEQDRARLARQQQELEKRADWANAQQRLAEQRTKWARNLETELTATRGHADELQALIEERTAWALRMHHELEGWQARHDETVTAAQRDVAEMARQRDEFERERNFILQSTSWRMTAPLRGIRRRVTALVTGLRFRIARITALGRRGRLSLRSRGLRGTLARLRREVRPDTLPANTFELPPEVSQETAIEGLQLALPDAPQASIVVPVYNHLEHTLTCLRALAMHPQRHSFEVIVVDDCSQDASGDLLPAIPGLRYQRNAENLGFIGACNAGAAAARGDFVVFLNNDTAVQPGWLDALLDTFAAHPDAGLVGAKLVYPDGRLQEAGGIVFSDGSGWNYGRFDDPAAPQYNFVREVDYCSGAAIALRRSLFESLGRFDTHYAPAYYEDTDLAMRVRGAGLRVLYQPASVVVHFEGISSGTDTATGVKAWQPINHGKFLQRWEQTLSAHAAPGSDIVLARQHRCRRHVLVIDATTPTPDQDSGSVRLVNLLRLLQQEGCAVTFFADNRAWIDGYSHALQQLGVEVLWHPFLANPVAWFAEHGRRFDLVLISRHYIASSYLGLVRMHAPQARLVFDTVDLHYLREQRAAELSGKDEDRRSAGETRRKELALIREADLTLVVSPVERDLLGVDAPGARVEVLSNVHEVFGCRRPFAERSDLMFVGGFQHPPNIDAAIWFVEAILPLVRATRPDIRVYLVGSRAPAEVLALGEHPGVVFHGFVEDLEPLLDSVRIAIAPLRYGAGVKGKINMSMSYGQPVVATGVAVEGMHLEGGIDVLVADSAEDFAAAVLRLYEDEALWLQLSANGLANVERHFSFDSARSAVRRMFEPA